MPTNLKPIGTFSTGVFDDGAAEINAYDPATQRLFVINSNAVTIDVLDVSDPANPIKTGEIDATLFGAGANSIAIKDGLIAVAIENATVTDPGSVVFFNANETNFASPTVVATVTVGALPDMVTFTPDGTKVIVANEGEPDGGIDPEGSVSVIDIATFTAQTATFTGFDAATERADGVRIFPGKTVAEDVEPEYISADNTTAYVSLQENNAIAVVDLATATVTDIIPLGTKDHSQAGNGFDASDDDNAINIQTQPVLGLYMPDAIATYEANGQTYIVTANEGDARDEDARIKDLVLDPTAFPDAATLQLDENLGRLEVSTIDGDTDGDGDYDQLFAYGSRSFTIFDTSGNVVFDSGDDFEQITAAAFPANFNANNDENDFDSRSDAKGPEPEGVAIGEVDGKIYAFVGLERVGGIMVYDVTDPTNAAFVEYVNNRDFSGDAAAGTAGDLGPEGLTFIAAADSPNGKPLLVVSNEVSGTTTVYDVQGTADESSLVISEIMYNPASTEDNWEWVELFNAGDSAIDLSGYVLDDGNTVLQTTANIAGGSIAAGETAILYNADDVSAADFEAAWGTGINLIGVTNWSSLQLNNGGDTVALWDSFASYSGDEATFANVVARVDYDDAGDWPTDDGAASIYLTDLAADSNDGTNWALSTEGATTPAGDAYVSAAESGNSGSDIASPGGTLLPPTPSFVLNELRISSPSSSDDTSNFVEIFGDANTALDGLSVIVISGEFEPGQVDFAIDLTGGSTDSDGIALVADDGTAAATDSGDVLLSDLDFFGSPSTFLLVDGFTGSQGTDLDADNDGVLDATPWNSVLDSVSLIDGDGNADFSYSETVFGPSGNFPPAGLARIPNGTGDFQTLEFGDQTLDTPGELNAFPTNDFDLQITEIWPGQEGADVTEDWFEIVNQGADAWVSGVDPDLFYDDESADPAAADPILGLTQLDPGEAAIVVVGNAADADAFRTVWGEVIDLADVEIGFTDGAGLGQGGDAVNLFVGTPAPNTIADTEAYPDTDGFSGASYDVALSAFSVAGQNGAVTTTVFGGLNDDEPAVGSPGNGDPIGPVEITRIYEIQGESQVSPFVLANGQTVANFFDTLPAETFNISGEDVTTTGIVTAVDTNGFYLQDATGDGNIATSDAIFVFTDSNPGVNVGDELQVAGTVAEFFPGDTDTRNLPLTQLTSPTVTTLSTGNALPDAVILGAGGRVPPSENIDDDTFGAYEPTTDGIDFFESLEAMRVTAQNAVAVSGTNRFGEIFTVVDGGTDATGISDRGTLNISPDDFNPEKVQIDEDSGVFNFDFPEVDAGAVLGDVTGVVSYSFGNFEILPTEDFTANITASDLQPEITTIAGDDDTLTVASYNVLNLDPIVEDQAKTNNGEARNVDDDEGDGRFDAIAQQIVNNLNTPDIIGLQEIQDNTGGEIVDDVIAADITLQKLIDAIVAAGGPQYEFIDNTFITDEASGGQPGGNIRTAFLYNPDRVSVDENSIQTIGGQGSGEAFEGARLPLVATFEFNGQDVTVVNNHFSSKGGSAPILGIEQPFDERQEDVSVNGSLDERQRQSQAVQDFVNGLSPDANVVVVGDFNEFEFVSPVEDLENNTNLTNLTNTLPEDERYSFIFQGNSQALDHILVSEGLADTAEFDIVHVNSEFAETDSRASDHDPLLASITLAPTEPNRIEGTADDDRLRGTNDADFIVGKNGDDNISARGGDDVVEGGWGRDIIRGGSGNDVLAADRVDRFQDFGGDGGKIFGDSGDDLLIGGNNSDFLNGGSDDDQLLGKDGDDELKGGGGNDLLNGGVGNDRLIGNGGIDTADYSDLVIKGVFGTIAGLDANLMSRKIKHSSTNNALTWLDTVRSIENVTGTQRNDRFIGDRKDNVFDGQGEVGRRNRQTQFMALNGDAYKVTADVVEYRGSQSDYTFIGAADSFTVSGRRIGTDTLIDIEFVRFNADDSVIATTDLVFA
ncbi:choice-of-anchor I family protein [Oscillatoria sp. CS-180]|uniref:choice-of-anchor I family protein n=1 Tax=Oscillatoria sp. CS-180 TaxID=3021720 RepID=UPI00232D546C|nr:choice-of-anchor I family protein [Oscillatoria sp. CS-180]MDB9527891.1 choice-of-anchor I family protein [Oscillatoria sp. CS-180]